MCKDIKPGIELYRYTASIVLGKFLYYKFIKPLIRKACNCAGYYSKYRHFIF